MIGRAGSSSAWIIQVDDLSSEQTRALLSLHLAGMQKSSPAGNVFALDLTGLQDSAITVWSAWEGEQIAGIIALKCLDAGHGEIKSMRPHPDYLRKGVAAALLEYVIHEARRRGFRQLSLETGSGTAFEPAIALYRKYGFRDGLSFSIYQQSDFNQFFHLIL